MKRFLVLLTLLVIPAAMPAADWLQFRGPASSGVANAADAPGPATFGEASIAWKLDLPGRGLSSPVVVGDKVFVTCASGSAQDRLHVFCIAAGKGNVVWERRFWATGRTMTQSKTCVAAPSPCSDGRRIFALFSSNDLICLDLEGNLLWYRGLTCDYPNASNSLGLASSPVLVDGTLIAQIENDSQSFAAGIDPDTGKNRWQISRPKSANWASPVILPGESAAIGLQSSKGLLAIAARTGEQLWDYAEPASTIPSATVAEGVVFVPSKGITALKPAAAGAAPELLWRSAQIAPGTSSPIVVGKMLLTLKGGVLTAASVATGERMWRVRVEGAHSATPVASGNFLYLFNEDGLGQVVDLSGPEGRVTGEIKLGNMILATPAVSGGALFVRSDHFLWKLR